MHGALWPESAGASLERFLASEGRKQVLDKAVAERVTWRIDMEWIIVRPVGLLDQPATGRYTAGPLGSVSV